MHLPRTLEPEVMDDYAEVAAYDALDHQAVNRAFVADLLQFQPALDEVLDLGAGTGRIAIEICRQASGARVVAADLSIAMLEMARVHIEVAGLTESIRLDHTDVSELPYASATFGTVVSNSLVHHVPDPTRLFCEAARVVSPTGQIFFRDLLRPSSAEALEQLVELHAAHEDAIGQELLRASLHAALTLDEVRTYVETAGYRRDTVQQTSDRHWTWLATPADRLPPRDHAKKAPL